MEVEFSSNPRFRELCSTKERRRELGIVLAFKFAQLESTVDLAFPRDHMGRRSQHLNDADTKEQWFINLVMCCLYDILQ